MDAMEKVEEQFKLAVQGAPEGAPEDQLKSPGHEGMVNFFSGLGYRFDSHDIQAVYTQHGWTNDRSLTLDDVRQVWQDLEGAKRRILGKRKRQKPPSSSTPSHNV